MSYDLRWPKELASAGAMLFKATSLANSVGRSGWDFAVEIDELMALGLSRSDLRWLVCLGFLEHADELSIVPSCTRRFQQTGSLTFSPRTCFILTPKGCSAASQLKQGKTIDHGAGKSLLRNDHSHRAMREDGTRTHLIVTRPLWNPALNRLLLGDLLVKQYRRPAPNQQLILSAFQEEEWPEHIDDPLPPAAEIEPQRRLHEAVSGLNRHQVNPVLRFCGDGRGRGITWVVVGQLAHGGARS